MLEMLISNINISITKSYQRLEGEDLITLPKTDASNRVIHLTLAEDLKDYLDYLYMPEPKWNLLFNVSKYYLRRELARGGKNS